MTADVRFMASTAEEAIDRARFLDPARWAQVSRLAGRWLGPPLPLPVRPTALGRVDACRAVYVPLRQILEPKPGTLVAYVGSVSRKHRRAVWQRIVNEHQVTYLERLLGWDWVAVLALRDDTPTTVVRLIEAAVADVLGRPPACKRLPRLPEDWQVIRDTAAPTV